MNRTITTAAALLAASITVLSLAPDGAAASGKRAAAPKSQSLAQPVAGRAAPAGEGGIAGTGIQPLTTIRVAATSAPNPLIRPIYATHAPGDPTRLFIIEKRGLIRILKTDTAPPTLLTTAFLDIDALCAGGTSQGSEQGLLGLVFHPNYQTNGMFYVYYTANSFANTIARYQVSANPDIALTTGTLILSIPDTESNHNGGWMGFKPGDTDGYIYIATGDGGGANDQHGTIGNGQNLTTIGGGTNVHALLGKLLRLDIDGADNIPGNDDDDGDVDGSTGGYTSPETNPFFGATTGLDEIWAYGLRNPWRCAFDRETGDLYIADVGQDLWEWIHVVPADDLIGHNFGWDIVEGFECFEAGTCNRTGLTPPVVDFSHEEGCSITGGFVYRGAAIPDLAGHYLFTDYCSALLRSIRWEAGAVTAHWDWKPVLDPDAKLAKLVSFAEDPDGELYLVSLAGALYKLVPR